MARRPVPHGGIGRRLRRFNAHFAILLMSALRERVPKAVVVIVLLCAATALSVVDYLNDQQLSVALLFVGLVSFVTWYDSGRSGALLCAVVAVALLIDAAVLRDG